MELATIDPQDTDHDDDGQHDHDQGLLHDLSLMARFRGVTDGVVGRRHALKVLGGSALGVALLAACQPAGQITGGGLSKVPEETPGPYPGDGTNGPNVLTTSGIVRRDIRKSFGAYSGTAAGIPLTIKLTVLDVKTGNPRSGYAIYLWHCDRDGNYSLYTAPNQNYLRGVQATDKNGLATFTSIYPGCYSGRWPHIHFEVYPSLAKAANAANKVATSQLALPTSSSNAVYATSGYEQSIRNFASMTIARDMVFSDGTTHERPDVTGSVTKGFVAELTLAV